MKILNLEAMSQGRDIDIIEPILSYLELSKGYEIIRRWTYRNPIKDIISYNPDVVLVANGVGCNVHFWIVKFAALWGCKVITLSSEGDIVETPKIVEDFFWGWNDDHIAYEDLNCLWSQRSIDLINKYIPRELRCNTRLALSGATGFDKYTICNFMDRDSFKSKYGLNYNKIVCITGYTFDDFVGNRLAFFKEKWAGSYSDKEIDIISSSRIPVNKGYRTLIENNPDILFILKRHPLERDRMHSEFYGLENYKNTILFQHEENIYDLINISDILISFNSTTALEGWLLKKPTLFYNPIKGDFSRSKITEGCPIIHKYSELNKAIHEFYDTEKIAIFEALKGKRDSVIKDIIGFDDGRNFIRASNEIIKICGMSIEKKRRYNKFVFKMFFYALKNSFRDFLVYNKIFMYVPFLSKRIQKYKDFWLPFYSQNQREENAKLYKERVKSFLTRSEM